MVQICQASMVCRAWHGALSFVALAEPTRAKSASAKDVVKSSATLHLWWYCVRCSGVPSSLRFECWQYLCAVENFQHERAHALIHIVESNEKEQKESNSEYRKVGRGEALFDDVGTGATRCSMYWELVRRGAKSQWVDAIQLDVMRVYGSAAPHKRRSLSRRVTIPFAEVLY